MRSWKFCTRCSKCEVVVVDQVVTEWFARSSCGTWPISSVFSVFNNYGACYQGSWCVLRASVCMSAEITNQSNQRVLQTVSDKQRVGTHTHTHTECSTLARPSQVSCSTGTGELIQTVKELSLYSSPPPLASEDKADLTFAPGSMKEPTPVNGFTEGYPGSDVHCLSDHNNQSHGGPVSMTHHISETTSDTVEWSGHRREAKAARKGGRDGSLLPSGEFTQSPIAHKLLHCPIGCLGNRVLHRHLM